MKIHKLDKPKILPIKECLKLQKEEQEHKAGKKIDPHSKYYQHQVGAFLIRHPNPKDKTVHLFAKKKGYNIHKVEEILYGFATKKVKK